jgi:phosphoribosylanthranilate isomerase
MVSENPSAKLNPAPDERLFPSFPAAKICGLSTEADVAAALAGGAAFIGFVIFPKSPRHVEPARAGQLAAPARGRAKIVAVTVDASDELVDQIARNLAPDYIQLHGGETPERARQVARLAGCGVIKAIRVGGPADIALGKAFEGAADYVLYDAQAPTDSVIPGGNGAAFDWSMASAIPHDQPWFLAGGLNPGNVFEALRQTRAPLVDVSSGVERSPGYKDASLISAFLDAVHKAGQVPKA